MILRYHDMGYIDNPVCVFKADTKEMYIREEARDNCMLITF